MADRTPEEKLLDIIEDPALSKRIDFRRLFGSHFFQVMAEHVSKGDLRSFFCVGFAGKIALGCAALVTAFYIVDIGGYGMRFDQSLDLIKQDTQSLAVTGSAESMTKADFDASMQKAKVHSVFSSVSAVAASSDVSTGDAATDESIMFKEFQFIGIVWSETRPQVMIEDTKTKRTLILSKGETFGLFTVKDIFKDKAVIVGKTGEWEMR